MKKNFFEECTRREFLRDLLYNNIVCAKGIWDIQKQLEIKALPNTVMAITIDSYYFKTRNDSERQKQNLRLMILKSLEIVSEELDAICLNMAEDLYALLLYIDSSEINSLDKTIKLGKYIRDYIEREAKVPVSVGIGQWYEDILDLHLSYKDALLACNHKFFIGKGQVIHINNIVPFYEGVEFFPAEQETQLSVKLLSCDGEGACQILDELLGEILKDKYIDPIIIKVRIVEILINLIRVALKAGAGNTELTTLGGRFMGEILKSDTISDLRHQMGEVIWGIVEEISQGRERMNFEIFEKALKYINENFRKKITLDKVSDHVHISPYYFCHGFKRFTGMTFIEYLTKARIEEAKRLLLTTNLPIGEIGKLVGYDDPNYYGRVFKNLEGIPPSKFKANKKARLDDVFPSLLG